MLITYPIMVNGELLEIGLDKITAKELTDLYFNIGKRPFARKNTVMINLERTSHYINHADVIELSQHYTDIPKFLIMSNGPCCAA